VTYRVIWENAALAELDEIWRDSLDQEGIQNVATRVNTELMHRPTEADESRDENYRVLFKFPLVVWFRVLERIQEVQVLHVRATRR
jgi:plasmid stabilization system protein ParE